jgi:hypothetical protein
MRCLSRMAMAVGAIFVVSGTLLNQEPRAMAVQVVKSWSDVRTPTAWDETTVDLLVPGTSGKTSTVERIRARAITFRTSTPPDAFSAVVVPDPHTGKTAVLPGGRFFISDASGMTAVWLVSGLLSLQRSLLEVSTTANAHEAAIAAFVGRFTEKQVAEEKKRYSTVRLGESAPGFFVIGSQLVDADLLVFELVDGVLRLDLRSQNGRTGSFWVELSSLRVVRTQVSR